MKRLLAALVVCAAAWATSAQPSVPVDKRVEHMLLGGLIGDAAGAPVEFVEVDRFDEPGVPFRVWRDGDVLRPEDLASYGEGLVLMPYGVFRPVAEPYAHWLDDAPPGTLTDDTRQKAIVIDMLSRAPASGHAYGETDLAAAMLRSSAAWRAGGAGPLAEVWLAEYLPAARWVLGERAVPAALPPERMWGGLPTCAGQMALPPLAGLFPGDPDRAYRAAYEVAFIDNSFGRDLNAAIVAGLTAGLGTDGRGDEAAWSAVLAAMRGTDPLRYAQVPWVERSVDRWLDFAIESARDAAGEPARLRAIIERRFADAVWWEAHVTFAMAISAMEMASYEPLASMRLAIELGRDTDSTAQVVGLFMGAVHGPGVFPERLAAPVRTRLEAEYGATLDGWAAVIAAARRELLRPDP